MKVPRFLGRSEQSEQTPALAEREGLAPEPRSISLDFLVQVAEEVWRLERRTSRALSILGEEPIRGIEDSANRLKDTLSRSGVHAEDHTGEQYREGHRLTILHVEGEPTEGEALWILETVRPTVVFQDHVISQGQVILGSKVDSTSQDGI